MYVQNTKFKNKCVKLQWFPKKFYGMMSSSGIDRKRKYNWKREDCVYVKGEYESNMQTNHYLRWENKVNKYRVLPYCETLMYMQMQTYKHD